MSTLELTRKTRSEALRGYRVLVVEDDYYIAVDLCSMLEDCGATVLGPVPTIAAGRNLTRESTPDCVLLDVNLHGEFVFEFADELQTRGVHTIFTTGYDPDFIPPRLRRVDYLQKPVEATTLVRAIRSDDAGGP